MSEISNEFMIEAIEESKKSINEDDRVHPKVGAVIVENGKIISRAFRGEIRGSHAEFVALRKINDKTLENATVYTTLEPCTTRNHPKRPCSERLISKKVGHVVIGMLDPNPTISGKGVRFLRKSGVKVSFFPDDLMKLVETLNQDFDNQFEIIKLTHEKQTIGNFQIQLSKIYSKVNSNLSIEYLYSYLHRSVDFLIQDFSKVQSNDDTFEVEPFLRTFSWLFALATKLGVDMEKAFFKKYPNICPYCLEERCICYITGKQPRPRFNPATRKRCVVETYQIENELEMQYDSIKRREVFGFDFAIETLSSIYPTNRLIWEKSGPYNHVVKLMEELGEVHEVISRFHKEDNIHASRLFSEELSDVLAWLLSAWNIISPTLSLDLKISEYFANGCPVCNSETCICKEYMGRFDSLIEGHVIFKVKESLGKLNEIFNNQIITTLYNSLVEVEKSESDPQIRLCFREISYHLESIESSGKIPNESFKESIALIHEIIRILHPINER